MTKKRTPSLTPDQLEQIAILLTEHEQSQMKIAEMFGVSEGTISRAVRHRAAEWLVQKFTITKKMNDANYDAVRNFLGVSELERKLKKVNGNCRNFRELHLCSPDTSPASGNHEEIVKNAAKSMAKLVAKQLRGRQLKTVGVSWGWLLWNLIDYLRGEIKSPIFRDRPIRCIPLVGTPPDVETNDEINASHLAAELSYILNGNIGERYGFSVGAWIPDEFSEQEVEVIRRFCKTSPAYMKVFEDPCLIEDLDCMITSAGALGNRSDPWFQAAAKASGTNPDLNEFRKLTVGNIAGCFLASNDLPRDKTQIINRVNNRWLGIQLPHIVKCAQKGASGKVPGVILLSVGEQKGEIVLEAIRRGLVNILIIDDTLKARLKELTRTV